MENTGQVIKQKRTIALITCPILRILMTKPDTPRECHHGLSRIDNSHLGSVGYRLHRIS